MFRSLLTLAVSSCVLIAPAAPQGVTSVRRLPPALDAAPQLADVCTSGPALAPDFGFARDLSPFASLWGCAASGPHPWSGAFLPDGGALYLAMFGGVIGSSNCIVAKLDPTTLVPLAVLAVGDGPQEIALLTDASGALLRGFVTNSTQSSVSVFDAADQVVATIPIPTASPWGTAFPSGMAVSPDGARVFVGTGDGSGKVFVIDTRSLTLVAGETLSLGAGNGFGRMLFADETLVLTMTTFDPGFTGSTAHVAFVDPTRPWRTVVRTLAGVHDGSAFPSTVDAALVCDGQVVVAGFDMGPQVFWFDAPSRRLLDAVPTGTANAQGKLHGLASGPNGLIAVADYVSDEVAWIDAATRALVGLTDLGSLPGWHTNVNDVLFTPGGARLVVVAEGSSSLVSFDVR